MFRDGNWQDIGGPARPKGPLSREGKPWPRRRVPHVLWRRMGLVAVLALASLGGMAAVGLSLIHDAAQAEVARDAGFIAKLVRGRLQDMADDSQTLLRVLAASPEVPGPERAACDRRLAGLMALPELQQRYTGVIVLTGELVPACSSFEPSQLRRIQDLAFLREAARAGGFVLGDYRVGEASGAAILPAALAFRPADRPDAAHLIAIGIRFDALQQTLAEFVLPPSVGIFVLDGQGQVVAARHPQGSESWIGRSVAGTALWRAAGADGIGTYRGPGFDGTPRIAAFRQASPEPGRLRVVATYPRDEALRRMFGDIRSGLSWLTATFVLVALVLLAGGYLLVLRYVERVTQAGRRLIAALPAVLPEGQAAQDMRLADLPQISDAVAQALLYLRQREADLELSQQLAGVTSWRWSRGQAGITVSARFREALGFPAGLALPDTLADYLALVPPEERETVEAGLRALFRQGEPLDLEHRMILPDRQGGTVVRHLVLRGRPLPVEDGRRHFIGALQDVTDLRALQRAYDHERTFLRTLLDSMDEGVLACDAEGMLVYGNRKEEEIGGPLKPVHVDEVAAAYAILEADGVTPVRPEATVIGRALRGIPVDGVTIVQAMPDRQRRTLRITGRPIVDRGGVLLGGMIIQQDLTELLAERDAVQDREAEFRQIFEASRDGNLVLLPDGEILLANVAAQRMLGIGEDGPHGRRLPEIWTYLDEERMHRLAGAAEGETVRLELEAAPPGRPKLLLDLTASPMRFRGRWAILLVARDITARRETEEKLRGIQRLEVVGRLAGGIAHDFNNLLQIVILNLDLLAVEAQGNDLGDTAGEAVAAALEAALRGSELTQQLLTHSMQQSLEPGILELGNAIRSARPLLSRLLGAGIILREVPGEHAAWVRTDPAQLDLALSHLVINAREAMPAGGTLTIGTALVRFDEGPEDLPPGTYALLSVTDDGVGMSKEVRGRAFEPFFTTREAGQGSGLGLSMVFGFMRQCGGTAYVESEPGRGTTVTLCFPEVAPPAGHAAPAPVAQGLPDAGRVLVVEDDEAVRTVLCRHLAELGWATVATARAEEALARLSAENGDIALVLSDITMPGAMNGIDLAWEIRRRWPDLPVLLASGNLGGEGVSGLPPGLRLLRKPFRLARLREAIERAVAPRRGQLREEAGR